MVRCDRFIIEQRGTKEIIRYDECSVYYHVHPIIYDRVNKKEIIEVNTGDDELDTELIESILTMLNIKYVGERECCLKKF